MKNKNYIKLVSTVVLVLSWLLLNRFVIKIAHAAAAYRSSGTFTAGTGSITPPYPASMAAGDVCLLAVTSENQAISLTTANGFAELTSWSPQYAGTAATDPASRLAVYWKRTTGGDSAPVVADSGNNTEGVIHCFSGILNTGNPWDTGAGGNDGGVNDTSGNIPGSTTTAANDLVVLIESTSYNGTSTANCSAWTNADLTNLTERQDNSDTAGVGGGSCMATGEKASSGAYGTTTVTMAATTYKGAISVALKPQPITTLGDGTNPSNSSIGPGGSITDLDAFTLINDTTTDTINSLTVTLAPTGAYNNIDTVSITDNSNTVKCSLNSLTSDTLNFTSCGLSVTTSSTVYKVRVTPKSHANMPAPPGTSYDTTGTVTSITSANSYTVTGTDSASATVTIDNASPNGATTTSGTAGDTAVTLNWTTSNSSDFNTTSGSVVYRWTAASAGSEVPAEGSIPSAGNTNGTATVACVISSAASTALSKTDGTGGSAGCTTTALTNGQAYTYTVFQKDTNGNYDVGVSIGTFTPQASGPPTCSSTASGNWSAVGTWGSGCSGANGQPIAGDVATISAGNNVTVDGTQAALQLTVSNTGTLTFGASSTLTLSAITGTALTNNGSISGGSSSTMVFNGATAPTALLGGTGGFTGSNSFNNLTLSPTITGAVSYSMGAAFTATGNFTIDPTSSAANALTVTLSGTTTVGGLTDIKGETSATSNLNTGSNYALTTGSIYIRLAGTLTANGSYITINGTTGPLFTRSSPSGSFVSNSSTVDFSESSSDLTLTSSGGSLYFYNLIVNLSGKTGTLGSTSMTVGNNLTVSSGILADGGVQITGNATGTLSVASGAGLTLGSSVTATTFPGTFTAAHISLNSGSTVTYASDQAQTVSGTPTYGNLTISGTSTKSLAAATTAAGSVTLSAGTLALNGFDINVAGNWTNNGGTFTPGSNTVIFNGTGAQAINGSTTSQTFYGLTLSKTAGTALTVSGSTTTLAVTNFTETTGNFTAPATMDINGTAVLTAGTYTAGADTTVAGDLTNNGATFTPGTNTITFDGTGAQAINGSAASQTFYNLTIAKTAGTTLSVSGSTTSLTVNDFTETTGNFTAPATMDINGNVTLTAGTYTAGTATTVFGDWTNNGGTFTPGTNTVTFDGTGAQAINGSAASQTFYGLTLAKTAGTTLTVSGSTTALAVTNFIETTGNFTAPATMDINGNATLTAGTYTAGVNTTVFGNWTNNGSTFTPGTNTVTFDGTGAQAINGSASSQTFYGLTIAMTAGQTLSVSGSTTTLNVTTFTETTGNFTAPATVNVAGNVTLSAGTYTAGANMNVAGNWTNGGGTFSGGTGTVTLNGADSSTQAISGNTTFNNLIATTTSNTAGRTIQYAGSSTTTVSGTWTMNGAVGKILTLQSSDLNNWTITPTNVSLTYLNISRSTNTVGTICATYSSSGGNNSGYFISSDGSCTNSAPAVPTLDSPTDTSTNQSVTPALKTTTTDTNGDYVQYKIILCENSAMTTNCQTFDQSTSQTGWSGQNANGNTAYTSGTQGTYTIQTALQNSFTYYWKSSAIDPTPGSNTWGSTQTSPYSFTTQAAGGGDLVPHFNGNSRIFGNTIIK